MTPGRRLFLASLGLSATTGAAGAGAGYFLRDASRDHTTRPDEEFAPASAIPEFAAKAKAIREAQSEQTVDQVKALRKKYLDPVFGKARVWDMIQKLGMCIDSSDNSLMLTSQYHHVQQILEAMEQDHVQNRDLFLTALLHDIGKVMLLANEAPENVVGYIRPIQEPPIDAGLEHAIFQFGHDEFAYTRLKDHVPENVAWTIRYHSAMAGSLGRWCNTKEKGYLETTLAKFQPYDLGFKSYSHLPKVDMAKYRDMIEDTFPQPILF